MSFESITMPLMLFTLVPWFKKNGDFNLFDGVKSERPVYFHLKITLILQTENRKTVVVRWSKIVNNGGNYIID